MDNQPVRRTSPEGLLERLNRAGAARQYDEVLNLLAFIVEMYQDEQLDKGPTPALAQLFEDVGFLLRSADKKEEARSFLERSVRIRRELNDDNDTPTVMNPLEQLVAIAQESGDIDGANRFEEELKRVRTKRLEYSEGFLPSLIESEDWETSLLAAQEIVDLTLLLKEDDNSDIAAALNNLAYVEKRRKNLDAAEEHYSRAIALWRELESPAVHADLAGGLNNLAQVKTDKGDLVGAEALLREAVKLLRQSCGADRPDFLDIVESLAAFLNQPPDGQEPIQLAQATEMFRRIHLLAQVSSELGVVIGHRRNNVEAHALHSFAMELFRRLVGNNHVDTLIAIERLAATVQMEDPRAAEAIIQDAVRSVSKKALQSNSGLRPLVRLQPLFEALMAGSSLPKPALDSSTIQSLIEKKADAFIAAEYPQCFCLALQLGASAPSLEAIQLFLISIQYLDGTIGLSGDDKLRAIVNAAAQMTSGDPWPNMLLRLIAGDVGPEAIFLSATDDERRCQAHFYVGWRTLLEGNAEKAWGHFESCREFGVDLFEHRLAVRAGNQWPPTTDRALEREVSSLNGKVNALMTRTEFAQAREIAIRGWERAQSCLSTHSPAYRLSLYNCAGVAVKRDDFATAERLVDQLLGILRPQTGVDAKSLSAALNLQGLLRTERGQFRQAEQSLKAALRAIDDVGLKHDAHTAQIFGNLAEVKREQRDLDSALPLYQRVIDLLPADEPAVTLERARWLNNAGLAYLSAGHQELAIPLLEEALKIRVAELTPSHPDIARTRMGLAQIALNNNDDETAERYLNEALTVYREAYGPDTVHEAYALSMLAYTRTRQGHAEGEVLLEKAISIVERVLGTHHPSLSILWTNLALLRWQRGDVKGAIASFRATQVSQAHLLGEVFCSSSEKQRFAFARELRRTVGFAVGLAVEASDDAGVTSTVFDQVLKSKGLAFDAQAIQRDVALGTRHPELRAQIDSLRSLRTRISKLATGGPGAEGTSFHSHLLKDLQAEHDRLEASLAVQIPELGDLTQACDCSRVAAALPSGSVLIDFVQYLKTPKDILGGSGPSSRIALEHFAVFVLRAGDPTPRVVDLGKAAVLSGLLAEFREAITGDVEAAKIVSPSDQKISGERPWFAAGTALREAVFDPIRAYLSGCRQLIVVPDGDLCRLPFDALPLSDSRFLIDEFETIYMTTGRDALKAFAKRPLPVTRPIVVADPDYDLGGQLSPRESTAAGVAAETDSFFEGIRRQSRSVKDHFLFFKRLRGTAAEGRIVGKALGVAPWMAEFALEESVRDAVSPAALHVATHGFFLPRKPMRFSLLSEVGAASEFDAGEENPLLLSGLALAGANSWLAGQALPKEAADGLLTAEDVSTMNLIGTQLVVLSACETGVGKIEAGEGVLGLRRSFRLAGASTLVMSLWKVPDAETAQLMEEFYRQLSEGMSCAQALRQAQLVLKVQYREPYVWGAFICEGNPGPIELVPAQSAQRASDLLQA